MKPPFSQEEVERFEAHIGNRLPENLREYLLNVSRVIVGCYGEQEFEIDLTREFRGCELPEGTKYWDDPHMFPGTVQLAEVAYGQRITMVVKGTNFGTQWYEDWEFWNECKLYEEDYLKNKALEDK